MESDFLTNSKTGLEREGRIKAKAMEYKSEDVSSAPGSPSPDFQRDELELCCFHSPFLKEYFCISAVLLEGSDVLVDQRCLCLTVM